MSIVLLSRKHSAPSSINDDGNKRIAIRLELWWNSYHQETKRYLDFTDVSRNLKEAASLNTAEFTVVGYNEKDDTSVKIETSNVSGPPHKIFGTLPICDDTVKIVSFECSCKAGSPTCKHIASALLLINRDDLEALHQFSTTDLVSYWSDGKRIKPRKHTSQSNAEICEKRTRRTLFSTRMQNSAKSNSSSFQTGFAFLADTSILHKNTSLFSVFEELNTSIAVGPKFSTPHVESPNFSKRWKLKKRFRITGSICYNIYTAGSRGQCDWDKRVKCMFKPPYI
ncbi:hypothetical protein B566_EDAN016287 [Ephemera danica]|nr:hypothetical protein B566_EDAN016287 [Ephemera danica]